MIFLVSKTKNILKLDTYYKYFNLFRILILCSIGMHISSTISHNYLSIYSKYFTFLPKSVLYSYIIF